MTGDLELTVHIRIKVDKHSPKERGNNQGEENNEKEVNSKRTIRATFKSAHMKQGIRFTIGY